ncbi:MAG: MBL fold metallo-hydrolase [Gammaproteobacteria bacterium]|nr:MBL fold metallo-hydrolase [Gammaproteobacteria bacterium]
MVFRQLFDPASSTYTYLLGDQASGEAVLIDPVYEHALRDGALIHELGLRLIATLDTHVHADHVTGAWRHKERCGSAIHLAACAGAHHVDRPLEDGDQVGFGSRRIEVRATPGHTDGCLTFVLDDRSMAFTGDCLLIRGCGRTDFQQGSSRRLFRSVHERIFTLPAECLLYPGHDYRGLTVSSVAEETRFNPRLGGDANEGDFTGYMDHLGLPHPKLMAVAVPANLRCGRPEQSAGATDPDWAPLTFTFAGIWEIEPTALAERIAGGRGGELVILDVREPEEFADALGHIHGAQLLPLSQWSSALPTVGKDRPIVTVCRSGTRSAQASVLLRKAGFERVANLAGGMLRWRAESLPVVVDAP